MSRQRSHAGATLLTLNRDCSPARPPYPRVSPPASNSSASKSMLDFAIALCGEEAILVAF